MLPSILTVLKFLLICLEVVLIFNLLIIVHELGHFLAARWRGLVVEKFAIWFGKPIWKKTINGVEYSLGSIPAGGFVALPQLAPMDIIEGETDQDRSKLPPATVIDKIIVAVAGPLFSLGLAFVFAVIVWGVGKPVSEGAMTTVVGYIAPDSPAAKGGLLPGDRILSINGNTVRHFGGMGKVTESIQWNIVRSESPLLSILVERNGQPQTLQIESIVPVREGFGRKNLRWIGAEPSLTPLIAVVDKNTPAEEAGLKSGDMVIAVNDQKLLHLGSLSEFLQTHPNQAVTLTVERAGKTFPVEITPRVLPGDKEAKPRIGIKWDMESKTILMHPNPFRQVVDSVETMYATVSAVLSPGSGIKPQHLSGPVGIMHVYYVLFQKPDGWRAALWFSVILNVNLALLNLLPIPMLDGGHIILAVIEGIRRRPINIRVLEVVQSGFAIVIIGFMLYVTFFDTLDLPFFSKRGEPPAIEVKAATTPAK
ncbi:MAG: RIP metalloprotease RseP [Chthoniobacterales bacterium]